MLNAGLRSFDPAKISDEDLYNRIAELERRIVSFHVSMKNQDYMNSLKQALEELKTEQGKRFNKSEAKGGVAIETDPSMKDVPFKPWPNQVRK
jgi:hypothetical protein